MADNHIRTRVIKVMISVLTVLGFAGLAVVIILAPLGAARGVISVCAIGALALVGVGLYRLFKR
jgi:hypothetical protein